MTIAEIPYLPRDPVAYSPGIGIIGCGNISGKHLAAYRAAGYRVLMLCDGRIEKARGRRDEFFPEAGVTTDHRELLARTDVEVVDIATHVDVRPGLVRDALRAGKHVLSQKPFVSDLEEGEALAGLADSVGRVLAVNQNGRWAPHFSFLLSAVRSGIVGTLSSADFELYWPHDVDVSGHPVFSQMSDLILYDFGIHWFDVVAQLFAGSEPATSVYATLGRTQGQAIPVPTSAQVVIQYPAASATILLRGSSHRARSGGYRVDGTGGTLIHAAPDELGGPSVSLRTDAGEESVALSGHWWENGMHGTMGELLAAIEAGRLPSNEARTALPGLALCFAAMASAKSGVPVDPRTIRRLPV
ncbi:MAG TPA: Gfo/Idh/MocA family oxidoreductase [Candidatus Dormibacteraeota bacterium]|jgi:predicted dehydrogenase|nr:Gfo/Idh/MocA family oxidoreductase [Candidatus Dormibacteraeota bacterium]